MFSWVGFFSCKMKVSLPDLESFIKAKVLHLCNVSNSKADAENSQFLLWCRSKLCQIGKKRSQVPYFTVPLLFTVFENHRKSLNQHYDLCQLKWSIYSKCQKWSIWRVLVNLKFAVKQCYHTGQSYRTKIGGKCQN